MPRIKLIATLTALLIVGNAGSGWSQPPSYVTGQVVDQTGAPVAGARVSTPTSSIVTDVNGEFVVSDAAPPVVVRVERSRFRPAEIAVDGTTSRLHIVLELAPVEERVDVAPPVVDATTFDAFGSTQTVVSAAQVESLNALDLASALRRTPGVAISRFNPVGSFGGAEGGSVHVRGMGASRPGSELKTYVDGAPFYMGLWNHPLLDLLPVNGLHSVTVLKGPQPQTFGNTFSAIDLRTAHAGPDPFAGTLRLSGGSFGTLVQQATATGRAGAWELAASQGFARSSGHRDSADGRLANASLLVGYRWGQWRAQGRALHTASAATDPGEFGAPETRTGRYDTTGTLLSGTLSHHGSRADGTLQVYRSTGAGDWLQQLPPEGDTLTQFALTGVRWREQIRLGGSSALTAGLTWDRIVGNAQFRRVAPAAPGSFDGDPFGVVSPHLGIDHTLALPGGWSVSPAAGIRQYVHSVFASETAPHAGVVVRAPGAFVLRANYARGVNYPGQEVAVLSTLIPPLGDTWQELDAETMHHVEVGMRTAPTSSTSVDVAWFDDRRQNRYVFAFPPAAPRPSFLLMGAYRVQGVELSVQQRIGAGWQAFGALTWLDASRPDVPYTPEVTFVFGLAGQVGRMRLAMDAQVQSAMWVLGRARTPVAADLSRVEAFTLVNVRPSYRVPGAGERVEAFVSFENLFDRAYAFRPGYPMPGRSVHAGVTVGTGRR